jgi:hypothetical protein
VGNGGTWWFAPGAAMPAPNTIGMAGCIPLLGESFGIFVREIEIAGD